MKTIKVKETKLHTKTSVELEGGEYKYVQPYPQVPVAEAKLVLVECKPEEALFYIVHDFQNRKFDRILLYHGQVKGLGKYYKPILISETEKIEEGDCIYDSINKSIEQVRNIEGGHWIYTESSVFKHLGRSTGQIDGNLKNCYKVLALPEHFSPKLLQDIVDGKLKEGDRVLLECIGTCTNCGESHENSVLCYDTVGLSYDRRIEPFYVKLNSSGHITLHKLEEKMYTEDRVLTLLHWLNNNTYMNGGRLQRYRGFEHTPESLLEWFNTNVK